MSLIKVLPSFERPVKRLTLQEKKSLAKALENLNTFLVSGKATFGFRFKKINYDKYEFRIDARLRVVIKKEANIYYLVLVGDHNSILQYLRKFR